MANMTPLTEAEQATPEAAAAHALTTAAKRLRARDAELTREAEILSSIAYELREQADELDGDAIRMTDKARQAGNVEAVVATVGSLDA